MKQAEKADQLRPSPSHLPGRIRRRYDRDIDQQVVLAALPLRHHCRLRKHGLRAYSRHVEEGGCVLGDAMQGAVLAKKEGKGGRAKAHKLFGARQDEEIKQGKLLRMEACSRRGAFGCAPSCALLAGMADDK